MVAFNRIVIAGNLTTKPEIRKTPSGIPVAKFAVAINTTYKNNQGDKQEEVTFIPVEAWKNTALSCEKYLDKGSSVLVEGRIKQDKWTDKEGNKRSKLFLVASIIRFLSRSPKVETDKQPIEEEREEIPSEQ